MLCRSTTSCLTACKSAFVSWLSSLRWFPSTQSTTISKAIQTTFNSFLTSRNTNEDTSANFRPQPLLTKMRSRSPQQSSDNLNTDYVFRVWELLWQEVLLALVGPLLFLDGHATLARRFQLSLINAQNKNGHRQRQP